MMDMPVPSHYSDNTEGSILRDFVNEEMAQSRERESISSPRSELLSPISDYGEALPADKRRRRRAQTDGRMRERHRSHRAIVPSDASPNELVQLLVDQEHETLRLRRALYTAAERMDAESQRVLAMERANQETVERFRMLNESRLAAQRDALKASQELRLYQFQLETAQSEITRAEETLRMVQRQKEEAEEAATRARQQARMMHQERIIAAAREEGRKDGFEAGFERAQREHISVVRERATIRYSQRGGESFGNPPANVESTLNQVNEELRPEQPQRNRVGLADDRLSVSSPSHLPLRGLGSSLEDVPVVNFPPPQQYHTQEPPVTDLRSETPPQDLRPVVHPSLDPQRAPSPAVQFYTVDIPSASQLEQESGPNRFPDPNAHWVTAQEHAEMNVEEVPPENHPPPSYESADLPRGNVTMESGYKQKEPWYRTLSRRFLGSRRKNGPFSRPTMEIDPQNPQSWYVSPKPNPPVHIRDYAMAGPRPSIDSASMSTRMSQLDLVSPPSHTPNGSVSASGQSGRTGGGRGQPGRFKGKRTGLFVINEDPLSRETTPVKESFHQKSKSMGDEPPIIMQSRSSMDNEEPRYSNPKAVEAWRRSGVTSSMGSRNMAPERPPAHHRRPAVLTVPAPLAPGSSRELNAPRSRAMSDNTGTSIYSQALANTNHGRRNTHNLTINGELSPPGINIEPPSRSPSEKLQTASTHQGSAYLSPNQNHNSLPHQSVRSAPSKSAIPSSSSRSPAPRAYEKSTPPSPSPAPNRNGIDTTYRFPSSPGPSQSRLQRETPSRPHSNLGRSSGSPFYIPQPLAASHSPGPLDTVSTNGVSNPYLPGNNGAFHHRVASDASLGSQGSYYAHLDPSARGNSAISSRMNSAASARPVSRSEVSKGKRPANGTPNASHQPLMANSDHTLDRVASNASMRSTGSKYARYEPNEYLDPAFYSVDPRKNTMSPGPRAHSREASTSSALSYGTDLHRGS